MIFRSTDSPLSVPPLSLTDFVMHQFETLHDRAAVIEGLTGRTLTYAQLATGMRCMAVGLGKRGMRKGDVFAILLPNLPEFAIAFLGVAMAGGVVTTMNPLMTADEIRHQLQDTGAQWLLACAPLAERALEASRGTAVRETFSIGEAPGTHPFAELIAEDGPLPRIAINPAEDLLALPYSSGTSGLPKGVMLTHATGRSDLSGRRRDPGEREGRVAAVAPFFHILGLALILLLWLKRGGTIVALPRFDLEQFLDCVQRYRINTHPSCRRSCWRSQSIRWSTSTICPASMDPLRRGAARSRGRTGLCGTSGLFGRTGLGHDRNLRSRLQCASLRPAAGAPRLLRSAMAEHGGAHRRFFDGCRPGCGETGELLIRGPNVMKGYLNRPEANAATFLADGWMRTGDIAYFDAEGYVYIVDRAKELIKYNAYQVAPAELEAVLVSHPAVAEAAVIPSPDEEHGEVPKAFVVLKSAATPEELMQFVAERVASYKKVRKLVIVDAIPKSPAGKLLRKVLMEQDRTASH